MSWHCVENRVERDIIILKVVFEDREKEIIILHQIRHRRLIIDIGILESIILVLEPYGEGHGRSPWLFIIVDYYDERNVMPKLSYPR